MLFVPCEYDNRGMPVSMVPSPLCTPTAVWSAIAIDNSQPGCDGAMKRSGRWPNHTVTTCTIRVREMSRQPLEYDADGTFFIPYLVLYNFDSGQQRIDEFFHCSHIAVSSTTALRLYSQSSLLSCIFEMERCVLQPTSNCNASLIGILTVKLGHLVLGCSVWYEHVLSYPFTAANKTTLRMYIRVTSNLLTQVQIAQRLLDESGEGSLGLLIRFSSVYAAAAGCLQRQYCCLLIIYIFARGLLPLPG